MSFQPVVQLSFQPVVQPLSLQAGRVGAVHGAAASPGGTTIFKAFSQTGPCVSGYLGAAILALGLVLTPLAPVEAASALLESVKQNPQLAKQLCAEFKQLNAEGRSATSSESLARVASSQGLSTMDAEVLTTYVIGLYCPDVR